MSSINPSTREIILKIVYYGPGLCGKTTSLKAIHKLIPDDRRPDMVSVETDEDRTLFFDFLPVDVARLGKYSIRLLVYTVPGQVYYNSTRKLVLNGSDGVVFVADSQPDRRSANLESYSNLESNLAEWGLTLSSFPHVLQLNKRDLADVMSAEQMTKDLNKYSVPVFESNAMTGEGVQEAILELTRQVLRKLQQAQQEKKKPSSADDQPDSAKGASSIEESLKQQLPTGDKGVDSESVAAEGGFTLAPCWPGEVFKVEARSVEALIRSGHYGQAIVKSAQLINTLALRSGHPTNQEALFAMLHGVSGAHYIRFRKLVTRALRGDELRYEDAAAALMLATGIAIDCSA